MKRFRVQVVVGFTDNTWHGVFTYVEDFPKEEVAKIAEEKVMEDYENHPTKKVAFIKTLNFIEG